MHRFLKYRFLHQVPDPCQREQPLRRLCVDNAGWKENVGRTLTRILRQLITDSGLIRELSRKSSKYFRGPALTGGEPELNTNLVASRKGALLVATLSLFAIVGLLAVLPAHAQTTSTSSSSSNSTSPTYPSGHNCPGMGSHSHTSNSSTLGASPSASTG